MTEKKTPEATAPEKAVTLYHPTIPDLTQTVAPDAVDEWLAAGWRKTQPKG